MIYYNERDYPVVSNIGYTFAHLTSPLPSGRLFFSCEVKVLEREASRVAGRFCTTFSFKSLSRFRIPESHRFIIILSPEGILRSIRLHLPYNLYESFLLPAVIILRRVTQTKCEDCHFFRRGNRSFPVFGHGAVCVFFHVTFANVYITRFFACRESAKAWRYLNIFFNDFA